MDEQQNIIIYRTADGRSSVALFATSKQFISFHTINRFKESELNEDSVVKNYLTTVADGKKGYYETNVSC